MNGNRRISERARGGNEVHVFPNAKCSSMVSRVGRDAFQERKKITPPLSSLSNCYPDRYETGYDVDPLSLHFQYERNEEYQIDKLNKSYDFEPTDFQFGKRVKSGHRVMDYNFRTNPKIGLEKMPSGLRSTKIWGSSLVPLNPKFESIKEEEEGEGEESDEQGEEVLGDSEIVEAVNTDSILRTYAETFAEESEHIVPDYETQTAALGSEDEEEDGEYSFRDNDAKDNRGNASDMDFKITENRDEDSKSDQLDDLLDMDIDNSSMLELLSVCESKMNS
eukprot:Nk52_evm27s242 gene=Nk52_evmTU27s242